MKVSIGEKRPAFGGVTENEALTKFRKVHYGFVPKDDFGLADIWGGYLYSTPGGSARVSNIIGYICGVADGGNLSLANALAEDFDQTMSYLANYGGGEEVHKVGSLRLPIDSTMHRLPDEIKDVPKWRVGIGDDGTALGLGLGWYRVDSVSAHPEHALFDIHLTRWGYCGQDYSRVYVHYKFSHNGGMIYHGPGAGETYTVNIGNKFWGVHT